MIQVSEPEQQVNPTSHRTFWLIGVAFVVVAALVTAFVLFMVFARAQVVVLSEQQDIEAELIVDVSSNPSNNEVEGGIYQQTKTASQIFTASSVVTIDLQAEGRVRIVSKLSRDQTLVESTRLLTPDELLFRTRETVVVPAFGSVEVDVYSDEAGKSGVLDEETTFTIPGLNPNTRKYFTVESVGEFTGGQKDVRMVTATDLLKAEELLSGRLQEEISASLREKAQKEKVPMTGEIFSFETTRANTDVAAGDEADTFEMTVSVDGKAVFFDRASFSDRLFKLMSDRLPFDRLLARLDETDSRYQIEKIDLIGGRANIRVGVKGASVLSKEAAGLDPEKIAGVTAKAAVSYLESLEGVSSASIKMKPFWARRLPGSADKITVEVR